MTDLLFTASAIVFFFFSECLFKRQFCTHCISFIMAKPPKFKMKYHSSVGSHLCLISCQIQEAYAKPYTLYFLDPFSEYRRQKFNLNINCLTLTIPLIIRLIQSHWLTSPFCYNEIAKNKTSYVNTQEQKEINLF